MLDEQRTRQITAYNNSEAYPATVAYTQSNGLYNATLIIDNQKASGVGKTLHDAITQIRLIIEPAGWRLGVSSSHHHAGNVADQDGDYTDSVTIINNLLTKTVSALAEEKLENLSDVATQKKNYNEAAAKLAKSEQYHQEYLAKNTPIADDERQPKKAGLFILMLTLSVVFVPLITLYVLPRLTLAPETFTVYFTVFIIASIVVYGVNISAAFEYAVTRRKTGAVMFVAVTLPVLSALATVLLYSSDTASMLTDLIP